MAGRSRAVLREQLIYGVSIGVSTDPRPGSEHRLGVDIQVLAEPPVQRHAEAALGPREDVLRQQIGHGVLEHALERQAASLERRCQAGGELHQLAVPSGGRRLQHRILRQDWSFSDGTAASGRTVQHTFPAGVTPEATLTIADGTTTTATAHWTGA